jgi:hypothetical protein
MTGWQLVDVARRAAGLSTPSSRAVPEHIVPLLMFLAQQDANGGLTGRLISTSEWNLQHGYGSPRRWLRENQPAEAVPAS